MRAIRSPGTANMLTGYPARGPARRLNGNVGRSSRPAISAGRKPAASKTVRQCGLSSCACCSVACSRATPAVAYAARPKAAPGDRGADTHDRVRADIIGDTGTVTLRHGGRLHHIGVGRTHARTRVLLLIRDLDIRIINAATGELLRQLTLDPARNYQPTRRPPGPTKTTPRKRKNPGP